MLPKEKEALQSLIKLDVDNAVNDVFNKAHQYAKTKNGDISPEQSLKLEKLQNELSELIFTQTMQNI